MLRKKEAQKIKLKSNSKALNTVSFLDNIKRLFLILLDVTTLSWLCRMYKYMYV